MVLHLPIDAIVQIYNTQGLGNSAGTLYGPHAIAPVLLDQHHHQRLNPPHII